MSNEEGRRGPPGDASADRGLLVEDIRLHLRNWADFLHDERTGNPILSEELRVLAEALKPHGSLTVKALSVLIANAGGQRSPPREKAQRKPHKELPADINALGHDQVALILDDGQYLKRQIVDLGAIRFGIPRGKLNRLPRQSAIDSIRAAMDHERSLAALDRQAQIAGSRRA